MSRQSMNFRRLFSMSPIVRSLALSLKQPISSKVLAERYRKADRQTKRQNERQTDRQLTETTLHWFQEAN